MSTPAIIGQGPTSSGTVLVTGANSSFTTELLTLGNFGQGIVQIENAGTVSLRNLQAALEPSSTAQINVSGSDSTLTIAPDDPEGDSIAIANLHAGTEVTVSDQGTITIGAGDGTAGQLNILDRGFLFSGGTIDGNVAQAGGLFSPGERFAPGLLTIDGQLTQTGGQWDIDISGPMSGTEHDRFSVTGTANLAGTIDVSLANDFAPADGHQFEILSAQSIVDNGISLSEDDRNSFSLMVDETSLKLLFNATSTSDCNGDGVIDVHDVDCACAAGDTELANTILAEIGSLAGDADGNGTVEFEDFLALSNHFGQPGQYTDGDFDWNGTVDFEDFLILSNNFGKSGAASAVPVPEPTTLVLALLGLVTGVRRSRRN